MKTKTSLIAGLTMALLFGTALTLPINVAAEIQPVGEATSETSTPAPTLILPYFEVDTNKTGTPFDIDNKNGVDQAAPQTPKPPQSDQKSAVDQKTTATTAESRFSVGFDAVTPTPPPTDTSPKPPQKKGKKQKKDTTPGAQSSSGEAVDTQDQHKKNKKKHRGDDQDQGRFSGKKDGNKNSEGATGANDNVLWGDYYQTPSTTANPTPKVIKSTGKAKQSTNPAQWTKTAGDAQGRYSVDFDATKSATSTSHTSKLTNNGKVVPDNDERPNNHQKKHKNKHHRDDDDQNQGNN